MRHEGAGVPGAGSLVFDGTGVLGVMGGGLVCRSKFGAPVSWAVSQQCWAVPVHVGVRRAASAALVGGVLQV